MGSIVHTTKSIQTLITSTLTHDQVCDRIVDESYHLHVQVLELHPLGLQSFEVQLDSTFVIHSVIIPNIIGRDLWVKHLYDLIHQACCQEVMLRTFNDLKLTRISLDLNLASKIGGWKNIIESACNSRLLSSYNSFLNACLSFFSVEPIVRISGIQHALRNLFDFFLETFFAFSGE